MYTRPSVLTLAVLLASISVSPVDGDDRSWPVLPAHPYFAASIKVYEGGRGCAVAPFLGYSARHLWEGGDLHWVRAQGEHPVELAVVPIKDRDLVRITPKSPFMDYVPVGPKPHLGDEIHMLGPAAELTVWYGRIIGRVYFKEDADSKTGEYLGAIGASPAGSSGGCAFDSAGRAIGVVTGIATITPNPAAPGIEAVVTAIEPLWGGWGK